MRSRPPAARPLAVLARGLAGRCPRCGRGGLRSRWVHLSRPCPDCGLRFEPEEGRPRAAVDLLLHLDPGSRLPPAGSGPEGQGPGAC